MDEWSEWCDELQRLNSSFVAAHAPPRQSGHDLLFGHLWHSVDLPSTFRPGHGETVRCLAAYLSLLRTARRTADPLAPVPLLDASELVLSFILRYEATEHAEFTRPVHCLQGVPQDTVAIILDQPPSAPAPIQRLWCDPPLREIAQRLLSEVSVAYAEGHARLAAAGFHEVDGIKRLRQIEFALSDRLNLR